MTYDAHVRTEKERERKREEEVGGIGAQARDVSARPEYALSVSHNKCST